MRNFVDFHVHIDYYPNYREIFNYYDNNKIYALFVTNFPEVFKKSLESFSASKYVKIALGYHPEMIKIKPFNKRLFNQYIGKSKYLGEIGLDYSKQLYRFRDEQVKIFRYICQRGSEEQKVFSIHSRNAEKDVLKILIETNVKYAVFHWYTGTLDALQEILEAGYYLSLNPSMLRSKKGKEIIKSLPLDRILVETDGPYGSIGRKSIVPNDIPRIYGEFEQFLGVDDFRSIVYQNLNELLVKQMKG
ncbi:hydrolase [Halolactibacillus alkaliphilus]|uniref:Hydrolase n=1 Tax=Halolactibacillus alkaliphilus TaxID=442899 RepID=A0A511X0E3_9BACI|nr:TatD family hydrolase [Halolactibacillus alkaliphilus]GEN56390.1 hydrolase [Halolactibacillus alkaliphilus]GGN67384.1 hydrolase [Halolactibacillus alkaliphilus]SFO92327.1 TatD DNase family protein [Halolactibacillus alkaliphilus]